MKPRRLLKKKDYFGHGRFPVVVMRQAAQVGVSLHAHQFIELVVITGGSGLHVIDKEAWPIVAGDVFVIGGQRQHGYRDVKDLRLINILYDPDRIAMPARDLRLLPGYHALFMLEPVYRKRHKFESRLRLSTDQLVRVDGLIDALHDELSNAETGYRFMATALLMQVVGYLSRSYSLSEESTSEALLRLGEAISYMENHYDDDISLDRLAGIAHMSRRNFLRVFREGVGKSPIEYLIRLRIARSAEFLRHDGLTITEVAYEVRFRDSNYFARKFHDVLGVSPREYRVERSI